MRGDGQDHGGRARPRSLAAAALVLALGGCAPSAGIMTATMEIGGPPAVAPLTSFDAAATCDATGIHARWTRVPDAEPVDVNLTVLGPSVVRRGRVPSSSGRLDLDVTGGGTYLVAFEGTMQRRFLVPCPGPPAPLPFAVVLTCAPTARAAFTLPGAAQSGTVHLDVWHAAEADGQWGSGETSVERGATSVAVDFGDRPPSGAYLFAADDGTAAVVRPVVCP